MSGRRCSRNGKSLLTTKIEGRLRYTTISDPNRLRTKVFREELLINKTLLWFKDQIKGGVINK